MLRRSRGVAFFMRFSLWCARVGGCDGVVGSIAGDGDHFSSTTTVAFMPSWMSQKYWKVPAVSKVYENVPPFSPSFSSNMPSAASLARRPVVSSTSENVPLVIVWVIGFSVDPGDRVSDRDRQGLRHEVQAHQGDVALNRFFGVG